MPSSTCSAAGPRAPSTLARRAAQTAERRRRLRSRRDGLTKRFGSFTAADRHHASASSAARSSACSGPTAPASRRPSRCCAACCGRPRARRGSTASTSTRRRPRGRARLGYMAQKFSLYGDLSVAPEPRVLRRRLRPGRRAAARGRSSAWSAAFDLGPLPRHQRRPAAARASSSGWRCPAPSCTTRRCCSWTSRPPASIRSPGANSGRTSTRMVAQGVTVMVTTHFMDEAEYCDRVALIYRGR